MNINLFIFYTSLYNILAWKKNHYYAKMYEQLFGFLITHLLRLNVIWNILWDRVLLNYFSLFFNTPKTIMNDFEC